MIESDEFTFKYQNDIITLDTRAFFSISGQDTHSDIENINREILRYMWYNPIEKVKILKLYFLPSHDDKTFMFIYNKNTVFRVTL